MANKIISSSNQGLNYIGTFLSQAVNDVNFQSIQSIFADTSNPNNWTATEIQSAIDLISSTATFLDGTSNAGFIPDAKNFLVGVFYNSLITRLQQLKGEIITIHDPLLKYTLNSRVRGATDGKMYQSLVNNNQGNVPESSPANWLLLEKLATEIIDGTIQIATQVETNAGTNNTKAITSLKLSSFLMNVGFVNSKTTNGYTYLPNGLIFQWGISSAVGANGGTATVIFPIAFPNAIFIANCVTTATGTVGAQGFGVSAKTISGLTISGYGNAAVPANWFAIGY